MNRLKKLKHKILFELKLFFIAFYYAFRHPRRFFRALADEWKSDFHYGSRTSKLKKLIRWCWATLPRRIVSSILIALFIITPIQFLFFKKEAKAAWWNDSWQYRQKIQLTNSTGSDLTDFQVSTIVDTRDTSKFQATCADMRFTDSKGQLLDYWIEENNPGCGNQYTKVWIKVPKVYSGTNATSVYMYYGNPSATATQSGDKTFDFFDDFNSTSLNTSKWPVTTGSPAINSGNLEINTGAGKEGIRTNRTYTQATEVLGFRSKISAANTGRFFEGFSNTADLGSTMTTDDAAYLRYTSSFETLQTVNENSYQSSQYEATDTSFHFYEIIWGASDVKINKGGTLKATHSTQVPNEASYIRLEQDYDISGTMSVDYIFVRKYASADPTTSASAEEVGPGPIAYWRFDDPASTPPGGTAGQAAKDSTVNGNDGVLGSTVNADSADPTWKSESDCVSGKCLEYNGTTQYVSVDDTGTALDFDAAKPYTWSSWINYSGFPAGQTTQCFLSKDIPWGKIDGFNLCLNQTGSTADIVVAKGRTYYSSGFGLSLAANSWIHVEIEYDGASNWKTYINGSYKGSQSLAVTSDTTWKYFIGAGCGGGVNTFQVPDRYFQGKIDSVKIFPYQRSDDQVKQDYNAGLAGMATNTGSAAAVGESPKWMTDGLVGHWKMDESSGTTVADASGNGNTGTLTNAQETGTSDASGNSVTTMVDTDGSLSTTDDAYNNMILRFTAACGSIASGTERTITDYLGTPHTFTVANLADTPNSCAYEVRHQTGGKFGNGLGFSYTSSGDTEYIDVGNKSQFDLGSQNSLTASFWIKVNQYQSWQPVMGKVDWSGAGGYVIYPNRVNIRCNNAYCGEVTFTGTTDGSWHYVTVVIDRNSKKIMAYVDGKNNGSPGDISTLGDTTNSRSFQINENIHGAGNWRGSLDDVRIYNRALSPDEVKQLSEWGPGPVGWWKMDEGSGQTIADSSGNGSNGYFGSTSDVDSNDPQWSNGKFGNSIFYDGQNSPAVAHYSKIPMTSSIEWGRSDFTYDFWIKAPSFSSNMNGVLYRNDSNRIYFSGTQILCYFSGVMGCNYTTNIPDNEWHHFAIVFRRDTGVNLYMDGVLKNTVALTSLLGVDLSNVGDLILGYGTSNRILHGYMDDVRFYNYARTPKQVVEDMNAGHPVGGSPIGSQVGYWKFDEGQGGTAYDSSQNHQDLTLYNSPVWTNSGKFRRAVDFERDNSQYAMTNADSAALSITSDLTLSAWIKPESVTAATLFDIAGKWDSGGGSTKESYLLALYGDELRMYIDSASNYKTTNATNLVAGNWYFVSATYSAASQSVTLYVNGIEQAGTVTGTIPSSIGDDASRFLLGAYINGLDAPANRFDGVIDEVKVYSSALTPEQIKMDMNQGKEMQLGGQTGNNNGTAVTGQAAEYCVPGDSVSDCSPPVGEWKFDEKTGGTAHDTSGNGNNADLVNAVWDRGKYGSGRKMSVNSAIETTTVADPTSGVLDFDDTQDFTIEFWIKATSTQADSYAIYKGGLSLNAPGYLLRFNSPTTLHFRYTDGNGSGEDGFINVDATSILDNNWHQITVLIDRDGGQIGTAGAHMFFDGRLVASDASLTEGSGVNGTNLQIGELGGGGETNGIFDQVRIFDYARTPAQIAWDYNRGKPVGWWKLDEGQGTSAYDSSGNGSTGTLTSMDPPNDWVDGKFGKALDFDGSDDYVSIPDTSMMLDFDAAKTYTWSAWIKYSGFPGGYTTQCYLSKDPPATIKATGFNLCLNQTASTADAVICKGDGISANLGCSGGGSLNLASNTWYHLTVTYDGNSNWTIYQNGVNKSVQNFSVSSNTTASYYIGSGTGSAAVGLQLPGSYFQGQIDDVRMYNYVLTQEQIKQIYNNGSVVKFGE